MRTPRAIVKNITAIRQRMYDNTDSAVDAVMLNILIQELYAVYGYKGKPQMHDTLVSAMQRVVRLEMVELCGFGSMVYDQLMEDLEAFLFGGPL